MPGAVACFTLCRVRRVSLRGFPSPSIPVTRVVHPESEPATCPCAPTDDSQIQLDAAHRPIDA